MFGEFNEATQLKTSLANYSIEFNDLAVQMCPHRIAYLRLLGRPYTLLYVRRSVGRLGHYKILKAEIQESTREGNVLFSPPKASRGIVVIKVDILTT